MSGHSSRQTPFCRLRFLGFVGSRQTPFCRLRFLGFVGVASNVDPKQNIVGQPASFHNSTSVSSVYDTAARAYDFAIMH